MATYPPMVVTSQGKDLYAKVQAGVTMQFTRMQIGSGQLASSATLASALVSGTAYTTLTVNTLTDAITSGATIVIGTGGTTQTVTTNAEALVGATSISVNSFTANAAYASATSLAITNDPSTLTALVTPIDYFSIGSVSNSANTANIRGIYQNTNLASSTYTCEIGILAQDPSAGEILYAYANADANGDTIPAYADGPYSRQFQISIGIRNASSVTANVPAGAYVPQSDVGAANGVASLDANLNVEQAKPLVADFIGKTSVVLSGGIATKNSVTATQLDITATAVYFASGERIGFPASTSGEFVVTVNNSTYYLDYNLDGTTSFNTIHSAQSGYVTMAQVTTDSSGNIATVTDERPVVAKPFATAGSIEFPMPVVFDKDVSAPTFNTYPTDQSATADTIAVRNSDGDLQTTNVTGNVNPNLMVNPSAGFGLKGWTSNGAAWKTFFGGSGEGGYFISPNDTASNYETLISYPIPFNGQYTGNVHMQIYAATLTAGNAWFEIHYFNSSGSEITPFATGPKFSYGTSGWQDASLVFTTPTGCSNIQIKLVKDTGSSGYAEFRRVKVEEGSVSTAYNDLSSFNISQYSDVLFPSQLSGNGYQQLMSGLIMQWGSLTETGLTSNTWASFPFKFPIPFPTNCFVVVPGSDVSNAYSDADAKVYNRSPSGANAYLNPGGGTQATLAYVAFGN